MMRIRKASTIAALGLAAVAGVAASSTPAFAGTAGTDVTTCASGYMGVVIGTDATGPVVACENLLLVQAAPCPAGYTAFTVNVAGNIRFVCIT